MNSRFFNGHPIEYSCHESAPALAHNTSNVSSSSCEQLSVRRVFRWVPVAGAIPFALTFLFALFVASLCNAADYRWFGNGIDDNWGNVTNWEFGFIPPTTQTSGTTAHVFMRGSGGTSDLADVLNNDATWRIDSMTLESQATGGITLIGGSLSLFNTFSSTPKFIRNSDTNTLTFSNEKVTFSSQPVSFDADNGDLDFNAPILNSTISGTHQLNLMGGNDIFIDGGISTLGGTLQLTISGGTTTHIRSTVSGVSQIDLNSGTLRIGSNANLGDSVSIATLSGTTFDVNGFTENINKITGSGLISLGSGALTLGDNSPFTFSGSINGTGSITKDKPGIFTLAGVSSHTGATNITAGTFLLNNSTTDGSLSSSTDVDVSSGATFDLNGVTDTVDSVSGAGAIRLGGGELIVDASFGSEVFSGNISESGTFRKLGGHQLTLSGNNSFTSLILSGGTTFVSSSNNLGASAATILLNSTLDVTGSFTNSREIFLATGTFDIDAGDTLTQTGVIRNNTFPGSLTKNGPGTLVLGANNSYTGDTTINAGRLEINGDERINNASDLIMNGGTLDLNNSTETVGGLSGGFAAAIDTGGSSGRLIVNQSENRTFFGVISGAGGLTKQGGGTLMLRDQNTYDSSTDIQGGTLQLGSGGGLDSTTDVSVSSGATFDLNGVSDTVDSISGAGNILLGGANLTVDQSSGTKTFSGIISESGSITKTGGHKLVLSGNNTFDGGISILNGTVSVGSSGNLGSSAGNIVFGTGGILETTGSMTTFNGIFNGLDFGAAADATITVAGGTTVDLGSVVTGGSNSTWRKSGDGTLRFSSVISGPFSGDIVIEEGTLEIGTFGGDMLNSSNRITVNSGATLLNNDIFQLTSFGSLAGTGNVQTSGDIQVGSDNTSTVYSGVISGNGDLRKAGTGTMTITQPQTYTGQTQVNGGILKMSVNGNLSDSTDVLVDGTWDINNIPNTIDALTGSGSVLLGTGTLTVGSDNGSGTFSGVISESGSLASGALVKVGSGLQTLTGNNTYTNQTLINGGTLRINTSNNLGSGSVFIGNGARLQVQSTTTNSRSIDFQPGGGVLDVNIIQTLTQSGDLTGLFGFEKDGFGDLVLTGNNTYGGPTNISTGTIRLSGAGGLPSSTDVTVGVSGAWVLNTNLEFVNSVDGAGSIQFVGGAGGLVVSANDASTRTFSGAISGPGSLIKQGNHTFVLSGNNSFTGGIIVNNGTVSVGSDNHLGNAANALTLNGGTLRASTSFTMPRNVTIASNDGHFDVPANELSVTGVVSGSGTLFKTGTGNLFLGANNTYSGGTVIENGSIEVGTNAGLGANTGAVTLATGTLLISDQFTNFHPIILSGSGTIDTGGDAHFVDQPITGIGTLTKQGSGELELNAVATYLGHTAIEAGELHSVGLPDMFDVELGDPAAIWRLTASDTIDALLGDGTVFLGGNTLTLGGGDGGDFFAGTLQGPGALAKIGPAIQTLAGANSHSSTDLNEGTLTVSQNSNLGAAGAPVGFNDGTLQTTATFIMPRDVTLNALGGQFFVDGGTTLTIANPVTGPGRLTKGGSGTLILQAASNFGGPLSVQTGDVQIETGMTIGGLAGNGNVDIGLNELIVNGAGDDIYGGVLSGLGGKLTKDGPGTLTLTGINTYTGGTCINDGVLRVSQTENLGELGSLITFDGGTLNTTSSFGMIRGIAFNGQGGSIDVDTATTLDASGQITGLGQLTKIGDGTLQLSGFSTYQGGTDILAGEVSINSNINLGNSAGALTLDNGSLHTSSSVSMARSTTVGAAGGAFRTDAGTTLSHSGNIVGNPGSAGVTKRGPGSLRWQGNNSFSGDIFLEEGRLQIDASGQLGNAANVLRMRGGTLNSLADMTNNRAVHLEDGANANTIEVANGTTLTQGGVITDGAMGPPQTLAKSGTGTLLLTSPNTYTSPTQINAGTVRLSGNGQLPDVTGVTVSAGSTFDLNNVNDTIDGLSGNGDVTLGTGTLTVGGNDGAGSFNGVISGSGGLVKIGTGTQLLRTKISGEDVFPSTYTSGTAVNGGVLDVEDDTNLGDPAGNLSFDNGTLRVAGMEASLATMRSVILNSGGGTIDVGDGANVSFGNVIGGAGSITKEGLGEMTYVAANTYTGDTTINRGDLRLEANGRIADASNLVVNSPGIFNLNDVNDAVNGLSGNGEIMLGTGRLTVGSTGGDGTHSGVIFGDGGFTKIGAGTQVLNGFNTYMASTNLDGGVLEIALNANLGDATGTLGFDGGTLRTTGSFNIARNPTLGVGGGSIDTVAGTTLNATAPFTGVGGLSKLGPGTLRLGGVSTYTGTTQISSGMIELAGVERLANATDVTVAAGATLNLAGFNESIDSLDGAGNVTLGAAALNVGVDNGSGSFTGVISGTGDLLKQGSGTQVLTGQNSYSGATFVDGGELVLNGGGQIVQSTTVVGFNIGSNGIATADGMGTNWNLSGDLIVGLDGTARMNVRNGAVMMVDGTVTIGSNNQGASSAGTLSLTGSALNNTGGNGVQVINGTLQGQGTVIADVTNSSLVAPGNSAGILDITGNFVQSLNGTLAIEIGGNDNSDLAAPQYDELNVSGNLGIDGLLDVALLNGFAPAPTDTFAVASASLLAGAFSNVASGARVSLSGGGTGSFQVNYGPGNNLIVLSDFDGIASPGGDFDGDGTLDGMDVDSLVAAIAANTNNLQFDLTGDGSVDSSDLAEWLAIGGAANLASGNPYLFGDATLDGAVDGQDFLAWNDAKFTNVAAWTSGDFNADGVVDGQDFLVWNTFKFQTADVGDLVVPEPKSSVLWASLALCYCAFVRKHRFDR